MKAWVLHGIGDFRLEEADEPVLAGQFKYKLNTNLNSELNYYRKIQ